MKIFVEADFASGNGAVRWEGITARRIRRFIGAAVAIIGMIMLATHRF